MKKTLNYVRELFFFSIPVVAGKISEILFGIGDVLVAGRYSTIVLGALGVANAFAMPFLVFGIGIISAISPMKARRIGAGESTKLVPATSMILATLVGIVLTILSLLSCYYIVPLFGYKPEFEKLIQQYLSIVSFSITPALIFSAIKELLLARAHTVVPNLVIFLFNFFNIAVNILFMFGFGLGIVGAAIATLLSRLLMAVTIYYYSRKKTTWHWKLCYGTLFEVLKNGVSIGGISLSVASVFALIAILVGQMSVVAAATNNILINITSFTFMIPLSLSAITAIKVGHAYGAKDMQKVKDYTLASTILGVGIAAVCATIFLAFPKVIFQLFTNQTEVIQHGTVLLVYIAIYQIPDALQEIFVGVLRGLGETTIPFIACIASIWGVGLSTGCYLAYAKEMDAAGLWSGLSLGMVVLGSTLLAYFFVKFRKLDRNPSLTQN